MRKQALSLLAVLMTAGLAATSAHADTRTPQTNKPATAPWYERFTFGSEFDSGVNAWSPRAENKAAVRVNRKSRWVVTFGLQEQSQRPTDNRMGQASAGAFYDISPKFRVGGQLVVPEGQMQQGNQVSNQKSGTGVKLESAFRF